MNDMKPLPLDPPYDWPGYGSTRLRFPREPLVALAAGAFDRPGPLVPNGFVHQGDNDLTRRGKTAPLGERMVLAGRLLDADGRPVRRSLIEIWQTNASGRYHHPADNHDAPLDPNFHGIGRTLTDDDGWYRFVTVKPGAYPWQNHPYAWRPAHVHFVVSAPGYEPVTTHLFDSVDQYLKSDTVFAVKESLICSFAVHNTAVHGVEPPVCTCNFDFVLKATDGHR